MLMRRVQLPHPWIWNPEANVRRDLMLGEAKFGVQP